MTARIIKLSSFQKAKRRRIAARLPKVARAPRLTPTIRALRELQNDSDAFIVMILWIGRIALRGHDPRVLEALVDDYMEDYLDNLAPAMELVAAFGEAWLRRKDAR